MITGINSTVFDMVDNLGFISLTPTQVILPIRSAPEVPNSNLVETRMLFTSNDIFAERNLIKYSIEAEVNNATKIKKIVLLELNSGTDTSKITPLNFNHYYSFTNKSNNSVLLEKQSDRIYSATDEIMPISEQSLSFVLTVIQTDGHYEILNNDNVVKIHPVQDYNNIIQNRLDIASTVEQIRNNYFSLGLSIVIIGWIPIELAIREKQKFSNVQKMQNLLSRDFSRLFYYYQMKKIEFSIFRNQVHNRYFIRRLVERNHFDLFNPKLSIGFTFNFWSTIENSNLIFNLHDKDIQFIQAAYDTITHVDENLSPFWLETAEEMNKIINSTDAINQKISLIINRYDWYMKTVIKEFEILETIFNHLKTIPWLDLEIIYKKSE